MVKRSVHHSIVGILIVSAGLLGYAGTATHQADEYDITLARVIRLLPRPPEKVVVIDADTRGQSLHDKLQHVEGFVTPGKRVVYLVRATRCSER